LLGFETPFNCLEMGRSAIALLSALLALAAARAASGLPSQSRRLAAWSTPATKTKRECRAAAVNSAAATAAAATGTRCSETHASRLPHRSHDQACHRPRRARGLRQDQRRRVHDLRRRDQRNRLLLVSMCGPPPPARHAHAATARLLTAAAAAARGYNDDGQVGDGTYVTRAKPTKVSGGGLWRQVSGGDWHVFGIKTTDVGYGWVRGGA
jgi:hypothetical protein